MKDKLTWERIPFYGVAKAIKENFESFDRGEGPYYTVSAEHRIGWYNGVYSTVASLAITSVICRKEISDIVEFFF